MNLYLIGYRCTGKSTIGRKVATLLGWPFVDADNYLEQRTGRRIREIVETDGESRFRDLESQCLADLVRRKNHVIATGGGVILRQDNVQSMKATGCLVLLEADVDTIHRRLEADHRTAGQRPSLTGKSPIEEIQDLLARRAPFYAAASEVRYNTAQRSAEEVADAIVAYLRQKEPPR